MGIQRARVRHIADADGADFVGGYDVGVGDGCAQQHLTRDLCIAAGGI